MMCTMGWNVATVKSKPKLININELVCQKIFMLNTDSSL